MKDRGCLPGMQHEPDFHGKSCNLLQELQADFTAGISEINTLRTCAMQLKGDGKVKKVVRGCSPEVEKRVATTLKSDWKLVRLDMNKLQRLYDSAVPSFAALSLVVARSSGVWENALEKLKTSCSTQERLVMSWTEYCDSRKGSEAAPSFQKHSDLLSRFSVFALLSSLLLICCMMWGWTRVANVTAGVAPNQNSETTAIGTFLLTPLVRNRGTEEEPTSCLERASCQVRHVAQKVTKNIVSRPLACLIAILLAVGLMASLLGSIGACDTKVPIGAKGDADSCEVHLQNAQNLYDACIDLKADLEVLVLDSSAAREEGMATLLPKFMSKLVSKAPGPDSTSLLI